MDCIIFLMSITLYSLFANYYRNGGYDQDAIDETIDEHFFDWFEAYVSTDIDLIAE